jgi:hypothetical protein
MHQGCCSTPEIDLVPIVAQSCTKCAVFLSSHRRLENGEKELRNSMVSFIPTPASIKSQLDFFFHASGQLLSNE